MPAVTATWPRKLNHPVNQADEEDHDPDEWPAPDDHRRAARVHPEAVQRQAAGQDRDDRERHREVGEPRHPPAQFLGVAELVEGCFITAERRWGRLLVDRHGMLLASGRPG